MCFAWSDAAPAVDSGRRGQRRVPLLGFLLLSSLLPELSICKFMFLGHRHSHATSILFACCQCISRVRHGKQRCGSLPISASVCTQVCSQHRSSTSQRVLRPLLCLSFNHIPRCLGSPPLVSGCANGFRDAYFCQLLWFLVMNLANRERLPVRPSAESTSRIGALKNLVTSLSWWKKCLSFDTSSLGAHCIGRTSAGVWMHRLAKDTARITASAAIRDGRNRAIPTTNGTAYANENSTHVVALAETGRTNVFSLN